ncbi:hypothetical protein NUU61_001832 [Penicillium alfredii]|uniref:Uncharacterized protein n=1 Tax=Penicillium alfredii TaxID=1506179 RepID=A0A9W9FQF7_9EURO|nr:uncharacterized protein NUU61_001832 [Penicillium alfredii]KAJ5104485.1 hypothetical protein NUU61_001832 [Penicillium alfredii]
MSPKREEKEEEEEEEKLRSKRRGGGEGLGQAKVQGGPVVIPFENLFLRPATQPAEGDIIVTDNDPREIAKCIWAVMF